MDGAGEDMRVFVSAFVFREAPGAGGSNPWPQHTWEDQSIG